MEYKDIAKEAWKTGLYKKEEIQQALAKRIGLEEATKIVKEITGVELPSQEVVLPELPELDEIGTPSSDISDKLPDLPEFEIEETPAIPELPEFDDVAEPTATLPDLPEL
jgi:hypothetical protein